VIEGVLINALVIATIVVMLLVIACVWKVGE